MGSQKGEFGHDHSIRDDQASRLSNPVSNERLARMIEINGDKLDHIHTIGHMIMGELDNVKREVQETKEAFERLNQPVQEVIVKLDQQSKDIADLKQKLIDAGNSEEALKSVASDLDNLQKGAEDTASRLREAANPTGGSTSGIPT